MGLLLAAAALPLQPFRGGLPGRTALRRRGRWILREDD